MGNVMSGIAEALVATGVGIFVAIPAVVAYNVVQKRIGEIEGNALALVKLVTAYLKTRERAGLVRRPSARRARSRQRRAGRERGRDAEARRSAARGRGRGGE